MTKIRLKAKAIDDLIETLLNKPKLSWNRTWRVESRAIGFFTYAFQRGEHLGILNVIVDHDSDTEEGIVWILPYDSMYSPIEMPSRHILESIGKVALSNKWLFEVLPPVYSGVKCPHCQAVYVYPESMTANDVFLTCQNCGKEFRCDVQSREAVRLEDDLPGRIRCPYCSISYVYKAGNIREDGTISCQNCGRNFPFPFDATAQYSYHSYMDDETQQN